jgi:peptidoglycan/xylan/chitin deacetylase (PgdA/CDA1 family)
MRIRRIIAAAIVLTTVAVLTAGGWEGARLEADEGYGGIAPTCRVATHTHMVALTFDDGPNAAYTPAILRLLHRYGDRATFFVVGRHAEAHPGLVIDELANGMEVANHTWSHTPLTGLGAFEIRNEVRWTRTLLASLGVPRRDLSLFRAPFGAVAPPVLEEIEDLGMRTIGWSVVLGPQPLSPNREARALMATIRAGSIVLAHDGGAPNLHYAVAVLRRLLPLLETRHFRVVPVGTLLSHGRPITSLPAPWFWEEGLRCP